MTNQEIKEAIDILKQAHIAYFGSDIAQNFQEALQLAISHLETLQKVKEMGGVKRRETSKNNCYCSSNDSGLDECHYCRNELFNEALDLKDAELAGKLEGLEGQIKHWGNDSIIFTGIKDDLIQVIRSHILGTGKRRSSDGCII